MPGPSISPAVRWPFPPLHRPAPRLWNMTSTAAIAAVGGFSKLWIEWLNRTKVYNYHVLDKAVNLRPEGTPLITVSNHQSCFDDPVLWGILKWKTLFKGRFYIRHTAGAADVCFTKDWHARFFAYGQTVPVVRGNGVYQPGMNYLLEILNRGGWVHIFPEGKVNMEKKPMRLKWGAGRLAAECKQNPVVLPFWHEGMDSILPNKKPHIPRIGKKVTLLFGEPLSFSDLRNTIGSSTPMKLRKQITDAIEKEFLHLREETRKLHRQRLNS